MIVEIVVGLDMSGIVSGKMVNLFIVLWCVLDDFFVFFVVLVFCFWCFLKIILIVIRNKRIFLVMWKVEIEILRMFRMVWFVV